MPKSPRLKKSENHSNTVFSRSAKALHRPGNAGTISVIHLDDSSSYYSLDAWAATLWTSLNGKHSVSEIATMIQKESNLPADFVASEVQALVQGLLEAQLIEPRK